MSLVTTGGCARTARRACAAASSARSCSLVISILQGRRPGHSPASSLGTGRALGHSRAKVSASARRPPYLKHIQRVGATFEAIVAVFPQPRDGGWLHRPPDAPDHLETGDVLFAAHSSGAPYQARRPYPGPASARRNFFFMPNGSMYPGWARNDVAASSNLARRSRYRLMYTKPPPRPLLLGPDPCVDHTRPGTPVIELKCPNGLRSSRHFS